MVKRLRKKQVSIGFMNTCTHKSTQVFVKQKAFTHRVICV